MDQKGDFRYRSPLSPLPDTVVCSNRSYFKGLRTAPRFISRSLFSDLSLGMQMLAPLLPQQENCKKEDRSYGVSAIETHENLKMFDSRYTVKKEIN